MGGKGGSSPKTTPAEAEANSLAQPYLAEYNSGQLSSSEQASVNLADTNQTAAALQSFANAGMTSSSAMGQITGVVTPGTSSGGMQAGAGSAIDLNKLSNTQQVLQNDLNVGMDYLQIASGQAADLAQDQQANANLLAGALGQASSSLASIVPSDTTGNGANQVLPGTEFSIGAADSEYTGAESESDYDPTDLSDIDFG